VIGAIRTAKSIGKHPSSGPSPTLVRKRFIGIDAFGDGNKCGRRNLFWTGRFTLIDVLLSKIKVAG